MSDDSQHKHLRTIADDRAFRSVCESIEEEYGPLLDSMPDGIIITDVSGRIVRTNPQAEKLFGYGRGDLVSQDIEVLVPTAYREYHVDLRNAYIADPEPRPPPPGGPSRSWPGSPIIVGVTFLIRLTIVEPSESRIVASAPMASFHGFPAGGTTGAACGRAIC